MNMMKMKMNIKKFRTSENLEKLMRKKHEEYIMSKKKKVTDNWYYQPKVVQVPLLEISEEEREQRVNLMRDIFDVQAESYNSIAMQTFIKNWIWALNDDTIQLFNDNLGNIYVSKGEAKTYPCIVSHMDTVHKIIPTKDYFVLESDTEFWAVDLSTRKNTGIGGDDKCGIYTCLDNLKNEKVIKVAFFVDEEVGCVGSRACYMEFFENVSFVLQADRRGYQDVASDIMYTEMFGIDFLDKIQDILTIYKRELTEGGMTDVMQLAHNGLQVAMANFSCGYYNPHSRDEYVVIDELILTSIMFRDIIREVYVDGEINEMIRTDSANDFYDNYYDENGLGKGWGEYDGFGTAKLPMKKERVDDGDCSVCGNQTIWDSNFELPYCNNCFDYDYNGQR